MHIAPFFYLGRRIAKRSRRQSRPSETGVVRRVPSIHASMVAKAAEKVT